MNPEKCNCKQLVRRMAFVLAVAASALVAAAETPAAKPGEPAPKPAAPAAPAAPVAKPEEPAPKPPAPAAKPAAPAPKKAVPAPKKAAKPAAPPPGPEQIEGDIVQSRLNSSRDKATSETVLRGQVRVTVDSDLARFKRPVLYIAALYDVGGMWRMYDVVCAEQKTYGGYCLDKEHTPAKVSKWQPEIGKEQWTNPIYGDSKYGFFHGYHISGRAKLLGYRLELWQNGGLVDAYDSDRAKMRRLGVPDDWHVKGKHHGKIVYRYPPPPPVK